MAVFSDFTIAAFRRHVTIFYKISKNAQFALFGEYEKM
jgi:hypothetical protein